MTELKLKFEDIPILDVGGSASDFRAYYNKLYGCEPLNPNVRVKIVKEKPMESAFVKEFATGKTVYLEKVIYNDPATIAFWSDGTKTVSRASDEDAYSSIGGLAICYMKKACGSKEAKDTLNMWCGYDETVSFKDVRKKRKKQNKQ